MFALMIQAQPEQGLTLEALIRDIPHDGAAALVYCLLAVFVVLIWRGSRSTEAAPASGAEAAGKPSTGQPTRR